MVKVSFDENFQKLFSKLNNHALKERILKQIAKLRENPNSGKPMIYLRKGTRELYVSPFRLSYLYIKEENKLLLLDLYHKDRQ